MNSSIDYKSMSSMKTVPSTFDSVDSVLNYLREPAPTEVVSSTTPSSMVRDSPKVNNQIKSTKRQKKEKELTNLTNPTETIERLPSGRVRYGPITVNPRKQPSKTLFTGRRSKYEVLPSEEEEKRRLRRDRNRTAATKCREKRDNILNELEVKCDQEENRYAQLAKLIQQLEQQKQHLQSLLSKRPVNYPLQQINSTLEPQSSMVFGNTGFLTSIMEAPAPAPAPPLPPHQLQLIANNEEEFNLFLQPTPVLTNSAYTTDQSNYLFNSQQTITMSSSSIERIINSLHSPPSCLDNNNNNACSDLFNSAYGSSSCARQHSSSSEDDSLPPKHRNSYVC